jgi:hypothetical protein
MGFGVGVGVGIGIGWCGFGFGWYCGVWCCGSSNAVAAPAMLESAVHSVAHV